MNEWAQLHKKLSNNKSYANNFGKIPDRNYVPGDYYWHPTNNPTGKIRHPTALGPIINALKKGETQSPDVFISQVRPSSQS